MSQPLPDKKDDKEEKDPERMLLDSLSEAAHKVIKSFIDVLFTK